MRHVLLTLLTAFALAASGLASASAFACPMAAETAATAHDCCPDMGGSHHQSQPKQQQQQHDMDGCMMGMACRAAPVVAPTLAPISLSNATILMSQPILSEPAAPSGPLQQLFRPPRSI